MAFYKADRKNDRARKVIRRDVMNLRDFLKEGNPKEGFLITGGYEDSRFWAMEAAISNYLSRNHMPVVILHHNKNLDSWLMGALENDGIRIPFHSFRSDNGAYHLFYGMPKEQIVNTVREQCGLYQGLDETGIIIYANSFLDILAGYQASIGMDEMLKMAELTDRQIVTLADRARLSVNVKNGILNSAQAGQAFRAILQQLKSSANAVYREGMHSTYNMLSIVKQFSGSQIISICLHADHADAFLRYLTAEMGILANDGFLLMLDNVVASHNNKLADFLAHTQNLVKIGLCSPDISTIFQGDDGLYHLVRANITKKMIFHYDDNAAASRICDVAGEFDETIILKPVAPAMPWEFLKPRGKTPTIQHKPRIAAEEICEMQAGAAILCGTQNAEIFFVRKLKYK